MTTIQTTYVNALLADAAYVALVDNKGKLLTSSEIQTNLTTRLTRPQAEFITSNFDILTQTLSPMGGFDAVVWKGKAGTDYAGQTYVSIRGTQGATDMADDGILVAKGIPYDQVRDMVNWWLKATAKPGDLVKQIKVESVVTPLLNSYTFAADTQVRATGELYGQASSITAVNGHSLGGYLATAFTRLFGASVGQVNTFNSAGFSDAAGSNIQSEFNKIETLLGSSALGTGSFATAGLKQTNYRAGNGVSVTTNNWGEMPYWAVGFNQYGQKVALYQEDTLNWNPIANHSLYKQTDLLALGNALSKLDPILSIDKLNALIQAGSNDMKASYEGVLDAVRRMVLSSGITATPAVDAGDNDASRVTFHTNLKALQDNTTFQALLGKVSISTHAASASAAKSDFGQFLSLYDLSPITLSVTDARAKDALMSARSDVAAKWQNNLSENFSDKWLQDRSVMQSWMIYANDHDERGVIAGKAQAVSGYFEDAASGASIKIGTAAISQMRQFKFGDDRANNYTGGGLNDALYGGGGDDTLNGLGGRDWLEGGAGFDTYEAGNGDLIIDSDGRGQIHLGGITLAGASRHVSQHIWQGAAGETYTLTGNDLIVELNAEKITLQNAHLRMTEANPFLGISLGGDLPTPATPSYTYQGTDRAIGDIWDSRRIVGGYFSETSNTESFVMGEGNDVVESKAGGDQFAGQNGDDYFYALAGDNYAEGGNGDDNLADGVAIKYNIQTAWMPGSYTYVWPVGYIYSPGYWTTNTSFSESFPRREVPLGDSDIVLHVLPGTQRSDVNSNDTYLGGEGHDWLWGNRGTDLLNGGAGNDVAYGGGQDDDVLGEDGDDILSGDDLTLSTPGEEHGNDYLDGGAGNDLLFGNGGDDVLLGGAGEDRIWGDDALTPLQYHGDDRIDAGEGNDTVLGGGGDDDIQGGDGDDLLVGEEGNDILDGGAGNDILIGDLSDAAHRPVGNFLYASATGDERDVYQARYRIGILTAWKQRYQPDASQAIGDDWLIGGAGDDLLIGGAGDDVLQGGSGSDIYEFQLGDGVDIISDLDEGLPAVDTVKLGAGLAAANTFVMREGDDLVLSWGGADIVIVDRHFVEEGGMRIERIEFADGQVWSDNEIRAHLASDHVGTQGADTLTGGATHDSYLVNDPNDVVVEATGGGQDTAFSTVSYALASHVENLTLLGNAAMEARGNDLNNTLTGNAANNTFYDGDGNDTVYGGDGNDLMRTTLAWERNTFDGGAGIDTVDYSVQTYAEGRTYGGFGGMGGVWVDLGAGKAWRYRYGAQYYDGIPDTLVSIENAIGSNLRDQLVGDAGANRLEGLDGDDKLNGGGGADTLIRGAGNDTLTGGGGADRFVWDTPLGQSNVDTITDLMTSDGDVIVLPSSVLTMLTQSGGVSGHFRTSTQNAEGGDDYIVYNSSTGQLLYDQTGMGSSEAVWFATLQNKPTDLTPQQFVVL